MANAAADQLGQWLQQLNDLKTQVQQGKLSLSDYQGKAEPLVKQAQTLTEQSAGSGGKNASAVNPLWQQFQSQGFVNTSGGKWVAQLPFSQREYAQLPDNVLPTQSDIDKGLFNPTQAPMNRIQQSANPAQNPGVPTTPGVTDPNANKSTQDILDIVKGTNGPADLTTDQGKLQNQGDINAKQLAETLALQQQLKTGAVSAANTDYQSQDQQRQKSLSDLAATLATNQKNLFDQSIPNLAEQANTSGILRSTGFGDSLARQYANLTANTQSQLAQQGISDRNTLLGQQAGLTGQTYTNASDYANGLTDVVNTKIGADNAGLQRNFSLDDYQKQLGDAIKYGQAPATPGKTTGTKILQGTQAAASVGQSVGAAKTAV